MCVSAEETAFITYSGRTIGLKTMCRWVQREEGTGCELVCEAEVIVKRVVSTPIYPAVHHNCTFS